MGAATEISVDSVPAAVLSEEDGIFTLKEEHTNGYKGLFWRTTCFHFTPADFGGSSLNTVGHSG